MSTIITITIIIIIIIIITIIIIIVVVVVAVGVLKQKCEQLVCHWQSIFGIFVTNSYCY